MRIYHLGIVLDGGVVPVDAICLSAFDARMATHRVADREFPLHLGVVQLAESEDIMDVLREAVEEWRKEQAEAEQRWQNFWQAASN
jgi:hypothetical protein